MNEFVPYLEPLWPVALIATAATAIVLLTLWTYRGVQTARGGRKWVLLTLRLVALVIACLVLLRPTWEYEEKNPNPGLWVILVDWTKSMEVNDEDPSLSRWEAAKRDWRSAADLLRKLQEDEHYAIIPYQFDSKLRELDWDSTPKGDRTAVLQALDQAYEQHKAYDREKSAPLLGIILVSDGRENVGKPALESVIAKLARGPCPIHVIGMGHPGGTELQPDVIATSIEAPQSARVKDRIVFRGQLQAQRFVGQEIEVWLKIDGKTVHDADRPDQPVRVVVRPDSATQIIPIEMPVAKLPETPGDVKVSLWAKPLAGEFTETNNEVATYMTLTKEGLSVVYFDKYRPWEFKYLRRALEGDERISLYPSFLSQDGGDVAEKWRKDLWTDFEKTSYDVFIMGDFPASRFAPETPDGKRLLDFIEKRVNDGAGFLMIGGHESFGNGTDGLGKGSWKGTKIADVLPVDVGVSGNLEGPAGGQREIRFIPTDLGLTHFALRLESDPLKNREWWSKLATLNGGNKVGNLKPGAAALAKTVEGETLLAWQEYGKGRTAALMVDTTWRWDRDGPPHDPRDKDNPNAISEGKEAHLRFWRQLILWLAKQEEAGKSLRIELDQRRLASGREQGVTVQAKELTPGGSKDQAKPIPDAEFKVVIKKPGNVEEVLNVSPDGGGEGKSKGIFWKTDEPGEYEAVVTAKHKGTDLGQARARFMVYRDDSELLNRTANHTLLEQLARSTGGTYRLHGGLRNLVEEIKPKDGSENRKIYKFPSWEEPNPLLQSILFALFVGCICTEWLLRRIWGLV